MGNGRRDAGAFVEGYGRAWERWDVAGFVDLSSDEVVYVAHATQETVVGRTALASYLRKEAAEQGEVSVRMGSPVIQGDRVAAEFWVTATSGSGAATIAGCFVARLAREDAWEEMEYEPEEWLEDADAVIVVVRYRGRGKGSGVTVNDRFAWRYEFGGDRILGWGIYANKAEALEAVGLSE